MAHETAVRRLSLNVPTVRIDALQEISATSNVTMTELLTAALELLEAGYKAQAEGGRIMIVNRDGQADRVLVLPKHGLEQVALTGTFAVKGHS